MNKATNLFKLHSSKARLLHMARFYSCGTRTAPPPVVVDKLLPFTPKYELRILHVLYTYVLYVGGAAGDFECRVSNFGFSTAGTLKTGGLPAL